MQFLIKLVILIKFLGALVSPMEDGGSLSKKSKRFKLPSISLF